MAYLVNFLQQFASSINQQDGVLHLQDKSEDLSS